MAKTEAKTRKPASAVAVRRPRRSPDEVRGRIIDAAVAEFEAAGLGGATTAAISRRADVTEAQIFRLFDSKTDLFRAAIFDPLDRHFADFHDCSVAAIPSAAPPRDLARRYIDDLQDFVGEHARTLLSLIAANAHAPGTAGNVGEIAGLRAYFDRGAAIMAARVGNDPAVAPDLMVRVSFAAVLASVMFRDWLFPAGLADDAAIRRAIADFVLDGIGINDCAPDA